MTIPAMSTPPRPLRLTAVLRGPYGLLWAGQSVSMLGDGVFLVAFAWQIAVQWQRPALLGLLLSTRVLAELATLALGGWIVDRLPRRTTILGADAGRAVLLLGLAAALHRPPPVPTLAGLIVSYGVLTALFRPALLAYIPEVVQQDEDDRVGGDDPTEALAEPSQRDHEPQRVHHDRLAAANALLSLSMQAAMVAGPAIGASLVSAGSAAAALRLNSLSFFVAAATTLPLPSRPATASTSRKLTEALEGFRLARRVGWVGGTILLVSLTNLGTITAQRLALPKAAAERYGELSGYGATLVAIGAGAAVAAIVVGRLGFPREPGRTTYASLLLLGLATATFGLIHGIVAAMAVGLAFGFGQQRADLLWTTALQRYVPGRLLGRISAVDQFGSFLFLPVSFALGGLVLQAARPEQVLVAAGALGTLTAVIGLTVPGLYRWHSVADDIAASPRCSQPRPPQEARPDDDDVPCRRQPAGSRPQTAG
jgi:MFS family permease